MAETFGAWVLEVYLFSTAVLVWAFVSTRIVRQPARRLFVTRCAVIAIVGLIGFATWSVCASSGSREGERPHVHGLVPGSMSCMPPSTASFTDERTLAPPVRSNGCEPLAIRRGPSKNFFPKVMSPNTSASWGSPVGTVSLGFLIGLGASSVWLAVGAWQGSRLLSRTYEASEELNAKVVRLVGTGRRVPRVRIGRNVRQPFVIGVIRPTIVLPARFESVEEPEGRVEAALRHEWAHVRNGDLRLLGLLRAILPVLFAHPGYWWLRHQVRIDQETIADAQAICDGDRLGYAEALLSWARALPVGAGRSHAGSIGLWDRPSDLGRRIADLLSPRFEVESRSPLRWRLLVVSTSLALVLPLSMEGGEVFQARPTTACSDCEMTGPVVPITRLLCPTKDDLSPGSVSSSQEFHQ